MKKIILVSLLFTAMNINAQTKQKEMAKPAPAQAQPATPAKKNAPVHNDVAPAPPPANVNPDPSGPGTAPATAPAQSTEAAPKAPRPATRSGGSKAVKYKDASVKKEQAKPAPAQK